jgi:hypothetical protein
MRSHSDEVPTLVAAAGGLMALAGVFLPWATRNTVVNGDGGPLPVHAWDRLPVLAVVVLAMAIVPIGMGLNKLNTGLPLARGEAMTLSLLGACILVGLAVWMVVVFREVDPYSHDPGFEGTRNLPWIGAGLVFCGALVMGITGIVTRSLRH